LDPPEITVEAASRVDTALERIMGTVETTAWIRPEVGIPAS
jgi:hypothetical protein